MLIRWRVKIESDAKVKCFHAATVNLTRSVSEEVSVCNFHEFSAY
jgi:hypothetical protein